MDESSPDGRGGLPPTEGRNGSGAGDRSRPAARADADAVAEAGEVDEVEELTAFEEPDEIAEAAGQADGASTDAVPARPGHLENGTIAGGAADPEELEALEEVDDSDAEIEELSQADADGTSSMRRTVPVDDGAGVLRRSTGQSPFEKRIRDLIGYKKIEIYSLTDVKSMGLVPEEAIEVSDGVFKVKEEVVARTGGSENEELKSLVDSVVARGGIEAPPIGELLSIPAVELSFGGVVQSGGQEAERARGLPISRRTRRSRERRVMLTQNGFDYDSFRVEFKSNNIGIMKSLMRLSQKVDAIYAALLVPKDGGLVAEYSLGLDDRIVSTLRFDSRDAVLMNIFSQKQLVYIKIPKTGIHEFDSKIGSKDIRFMKGAIYLPAVFDSKPAYLFFGLKTTEPPIQDYMLRIIQ